MQISPQRVDKSVIDYMKESLNHMKKNFTLYVSLLLVTMAIQGLLFMLPMNVRSPFDFFSNVFLLFLVMELTFSSTQEFLSSKKIFASLYVVVKIFKDFIKKNMVRIFVLISIFLALIFLLHTDKEDEAVKNLISKEGFLMSWIIFGITMGYIKTIFILFITSHQKFLPDIFVLARCNSSLEVEATNLEEKSSRLNREIIFKWCVTIMIVSILPDLPIIKAMIMMTIIVGVTLYSMDVFGLDKGKKDKVLQEEKQKQEMEKMVPIHIDR